MALKTLAELHSEYLASNSCCVASDQLAANTSMRALLELVDNLAGEGSSGQIISAASNNAQVISNSRAKLDFLTLSNKASTPSYVKLYNKATAPNPASDTPVFTFIVPGRTEGAGSNIPIPPRGLVFPLGLGIIIVKGEAATDNTPVIAGDVIVNYSLRS